MIVWQLLKQPSCSSVRVRWQSDKVTAGSICPSSLSDTTKQSLSLNCVIIWVISWSRLEQEYLWDLLHIYQEFFFMFGKPCCSLLLREAGMQFAGWKTKLGVAQAGPAAPTIMINQQLHQCQFQSQSKSSLASGFVAAFTFLAFSWRFENHSSTLQRIVTTIRSNIVTFFPVNKMN